jgi:hypothetical protein
MNLGCGPTHVVEIRDGAGTGAVEGWHDGGEGIIGH